MPSGTNSDDIAIPLSSVSSLTQIVPSKRSSSTSPESDLPLKKSRNGEWLRRSSCYHPTHVLSLRRLRVICTRHVLIRLCWFGRRRGVCRRESCPAGISWGSHPTSSSSSPPPVRQDHSPWDVSVRSIIHCDFFASNETTSNFFESTTPKQQARRKVTFKNLAIGGYPRFDEEFGKYPVLYLDFSVCDQVLIVCSMLMSGGRCTECGRLYNGGTSEQLSDRNHRHGLAVGRRRLLPQS